MTAEEADGIFHMDFKLDSVFSIDGCECNGHGRVIGGSSALVGPSGGTIVKCRAASWIEMLPQPWDQDPFAVVAMAPIGSVFKTLQTRDGYSLGVIEHEGKKTGLQVLYPQPATWPSHEDIFASCRMAMMQPVYIGRLSGCPQQHLVSDLAPLALHRDAMWRPYLDIRGYMAMLTKAYDESSN